MLDLRNRLRVSLALLLFVTPVLAQRPSLGLMLSVTGRTHDAAVDAQVPIAIAALAGKIETVYLIVPAWQEMPCASQSVAVMAVVNTCRGLGIELVLMRKLWPHPETHVISAQSPLMPAYYASAMQSLAWDAFELGIARTGFDVEVLRSSPAGWLRDPPLMAAAVHRQIHLSIRSALEFAPRPMFVMPSTNSNPQFWGYALADLGASRICWRTYYAKASEDVNINPPPDEPFTLRYAASMIRLEGDTEYLKALTPAEFVAMDWAAWLAAYPAVEEWILYPWSKGEHTVRVCRALAGVL